MVWPATAGVVVVGAHVGVLLADGAGGGGGVAMVEASQGRAAMGRKGWGLTVLLKSAQSAVKVTYMVLQEGFLNCHKRLCVCGAAPQYLFLELCMPLKSNY